MGTHPWGVNATFWNAPAVVFATRCFNGHPPLGVNATISWRSASQRPKTGFNGHPPLGVNATFLASSRSIARPGSGSFNGHPPLGVDATEDAYAILWALHTAFQWAPTLGGECYARYIATRKVPYFAFQWAPTLGGECYNESNSQICERCTRFNGHPPLGVNATQNETHFYFAGRLYPFQWAPTLVGECYLRGTQPLVPLVLKSFNGHPPLGVNATMCGARFVRDCKRGVSMGTHPWG